MELVWTTNATSSPGIKPYAMPISHVNGKSITKRITTAARPKPPSMVTSPKEVDYAKDCGKFCGWL